MTPFGYYSITPPSRTKQSSSPRHPPRLNKWTGGNVSGACLHPSPMDLPTLLKWACELTACSSGESAL